MAGAGVAQGDVGGTEREGITSKFIYLIRPIWACRIHPQTESNIYTFTTTVLFDRSYRLEPTEE